MSWIKYYDIKDEEGQLKREGERKKRENESPQSESGREGVAILLIER